MFLTAEDRSLRQPEKALELALKSVELEGTIDHIDTLAEGLFSDRSDRKAIETLRKGIQSILSQIRNAIWRAIPAVSKNASVSPPR